jgi:hypothetical protein
LNAFSFSSLESIIIPRNVQFIDGLALSNLTLSSISIENGNERFGIENNLLIDIVDHQLLRNFGNSSNLQIPSDIEILESDCFASCEMLSLITFESNSRLKRIKSDAFSFSSLESIVIPRNVQFIECSNSF